MLFYFLDYLEMQKIKLEVKRHVYLERIFVPKEIIIPLPFNNRLELSSIPFGTPVDTFTDLSTAQAMVLQDAKHYKITDDSSDTLLYHIIEEDADVPPNFKFSNTKLGDYNTTITIVRNQIVMPDDPIAFVPARSVVQEAYSRFARAPKVEGLAEKANSIKGFMRSNTDELVRFRALRQHYGNCWSDSVFTILLEATGISQYILPIVFEMVDFEAKIYGTTISAADPSLIPSVATHIKTVFHLEPIPDLVMIFFMNGFQRYINKLIQYRKVNANRTAAVSGASLAPTSSLNVATSEYYQTCFHPRKLINASTSGLGGDFAYDLLSPLRVLFHSIAPERIRIEETIKRDPTIKGVGYKALKSIPEAYYIMIKHVQKNAAPNSTKTGMEQHKNHAVALFRKLELPELPEGVWYFYDDNFGVYKLPLEDSLVLNALPVRSLEYSVAEKTWTLRAKKTTAKKNGETVLTFSFGAYPWDYTLTQQIYAFRLLSDE